MYTIKNYAQARMNIKVCQKYRYCHVTVLKDNNLNLKKSVFSKTCTVANGAKNSEIILFRTAIVSAALKL
jgi:hypothetical protein